MRSVLALVLLTLTSVVLADDVNAPRCVTVTKEAPYQGYGYTHIVAIHNACEKLVECTVSTDATPAPTQVRVARGATERVVTRRGSPASEFQATVRCELESP